MCLRESNAADFRFLLSASFETRFSEISQGPQRRTDPEDGGKESLGAPDASEVAPAWRALIPGGRAFLWNTDSTAELGREVESIEINANLQCKHFGGLGAL